MAILPKHNRFGLYEIRLESIGGLGANLAGKMLAEAGVLGLGLNGAHFSSYGSEKKGTPVKSFIRFCEPGVEIRDHSPIETPDVVAVFHEALYKTVNVTEGLADDGVVLVNSTRSLEEIRKDLGMTSGTLAVVDGMGIAVEERTRVNTSMLGALFRICTFLDPEAMRQVMRKTFEKKSPALAEANVRTFDRGYQEVKFETWSSTGKTADRVKPNRPAIGYLAQQPGGVILAAGNSVAKDLSGSRQGFLPEWHADACIHCAQCDTACPDLCFVWEQGEDKRGRSQMFLKGIDYRYCKGCLKCVEACPSDALTALREEIGYADSHRVAHAFI